MAKEVKDDDFNWCGYILDDSDFEYIVDSLEGLSEAGCEKKIGELNAHFIKKYGEIN